MSGLPEGYRQTELGVLPETWQVAQLGRAGEYRKKSLDPQSHLSEVFDYYSIPAYQAGPAPFLTEGASIRSQKLIVEPDMVLFGKLNPRVPKIWRVTGESPRRRIASTEFIPLEPVDHLTISEYLYYLAWSEHILPRSQELVSGSTPSRQRVDIGGFLDIPIPLPPLPEQRAIAHVLRTVQEAREATERVIEAARELKRSLMRHLFTYGPVPVDEADEVELQATDYGSSPAHWQTMSLDQCAAVQTGVAKGRKLEGESTVEVPYLRVANVQDGYLDLCKIKYIRIRRSKLDRYRLKKNDIVLTEGGDFDKLGRGFVWKGEIEDCIHQNHVFAVRADESIVLPAYLAYLVQSSYGKSYFLNVAHRTTNLACINATKLRAFPMLVPELAVQSRMVRLLSAVDAKIAAEEARRDALGGLFHSLLHNLMTARVRVPMPDSQVDDEPKDVLE